MVIRPEELNCNNWTKVSTDTFVRSKWTVTFLRSRWITSELCVYRSNSIGDTDIEQQINALPSAGRSSGSGAYRSRPSRMPHSHV